MKKHIAILMLLAASPAFAATRTVTSLSDSGVGSLRQAIADSAPGDTINFTVGGTIVLTGGELDITNSLSIVGPGADGLAISGNHASRVFGISNVNVNLSGLTLRDGRAPDGETGGNGAHGGGLYNQGQLNLSNCVVTANAAGNGGAGAAGSPGGAGGSGGGICSLGPLTLFGCSLIANVNGAGGAGGSSSGGSGGNGGRGGYGGGLYVSSTLAMTACTVYSNRSAAGGAGGNGSTNDYVAGGAGGEGGLGSAIYGDGGAMTLVACTVACNPCGDGGRGGDSKMGASGGHGGYGGILLSGAASLNVRNGLISRTRGGAGGARGLPGGSGGTAGSDNDIIGSITSEGHNLFGTATSGSIGTDLTYTDDPGLGLIGDYGGSTPTVPLLASSPAIDAGDDALINAPFSLAVDQRGSSRKTGTQVDIGAFEYVAQAPAVESGTATVSINATNGLSDAALSLTLNLGGQSGGCFFQYGVTTNYGINTATVPFTESYAVSSGLSFTNLLPGHVYHYRFVATNATGATYGPDQTFTTAQFFAVGDLNGDGTVGQDELNSAFGNYWQDNPTVITNSLGLGHTSVQLAVTNTIGWDLTVQMSTNMATWTNLSSRAVPVFQFTDPTATGSATRVYRLLAP